MPCLHRECALALNTLYAMRCRCIECSCSYHIAITWKLSQSSSWSSVLVRITMLEIPMTMVGLKIFQKCLDFSRHISVCIVWRKIVALCLFSFECRDCHPGKLPVVFEEVQLAFASREIALSPDLVSFVLSKSIKTDGDAERWTFRRVSEYGCQCGNLAS